MAHLARDDTVFQATYHTSSAEHHIQHPLLSTQYRPTEGSEAELAWVGLDENWSLSTYGNHFF